MKILATDLVGVAVVQPEPIEDERGFFGRVFDRKAFEEAGLTGIVEQASVAFNRVAGTLRGMHYQNAPAAEAKLVRCTRGAVLDVVIDMRPDSETYLRHIAVELTDQNRLALYVPPFCAHGYQTLQADCEVLYQMDSPYSPEHSTGVRFDDPALDVSWPLPVGAISQRDLEWQLLGDRPATHAGESEAVLPYPEPQQQQVRPARHRIER